jgi:hypothetical protein
MTHFPLGDRNGGKIIKKVLAVIDKLTKKTPPASKPKHSR